MSRGTSFSARKARFLNRWHAARAGRLRPRGIGFLSTPVPRGVGSFARGQQLIAGHLVFAGHLLDRPEADPWHLPPPNDDFLPEVHGFGWLDDLAAVGDARARALAQRWLGGWIEAFGRGQGPGWTPELTGRRVIRWVNHADFLRRGQDEVDGDAFFTGLYRQTRFLARRWQGAPEGLPRLEALTGLVLAGLALEGLDDLALPAVGALARGCVARIDAGGGVPTRNPEELMQVFILLTWVSAALTERALPVPDAMSEAVERIAPTLRALRHSNGALARFHGGGGGTGGWLDEALAQARTRTRQADGLVMGFARVSAARTSLIVDASLPPRGRASLDAHASTLAFELTSGRRALVVNCGSGCGFGPDWRRAGRATPSHSTLSLEGYSSARLGSADPLTGRETLVEGPTEVPVEFARFADGWRFEAAHDGFAATHGLTHVRSLEMTLDGRGLAGEDMLLAMTDAAKRRLDRAFEAARGEGIGFDIRFHLHPDVDAALESGGAAVSMALRSGEIWVFRHDGVQEVQLEPSVYLEAGRFEPVATKQIVLSGRAMSYATRIRWSLSKAQETAIGVRDIRQDALDLT